MCEYCGCQDLPAISLLTSEHDEVVNLIGRARRAHQRGDVPAMLAAARQIAAVLGPHTAVEEEGLFPALATEFPEHIARLTGEHADIHRVLEEAADTVPSDPQWPARLLGTLRLLREHILAEQDGVFPAALSRLDIADWDKIDAIRDQVGSALRDEIVR